MPRPVTGRRPDSLFDNRYRYDYIYPRGRSGETLRAYDTQRGDMPVVIKRPALQDAPPIRAGQEVSILNEKRALEALSGHPVLAELVNSGTFRVGGITHHYIVLEMAQGETVEAMVLAMAPQRVRLPELEMLNLLDGLLDLLQLAHDKHIVYNDVDAKHLFWDREHYRLKMIDWGNAVFLDDPGAAAQHVTRANDLIQTGQLIYFILSGGQRLESGRTDPANDLGDAVSPRLKAIINRAVHVEANARYADVPALRYDLAEVRRPLQKQRDSLLERVRGRLAAASNQTQFEELHSLLDEALALDPGYPPGRELKAEIDLRLKQLAMQADLDAVRIYLESANLSRASALLDDLAARSGESPILAYLSDACALLGLQAPSTIVIPEGLSPALDALFRDDAQAASRALLTTRDSRPAGRLYQALLAERLSRRVPGVTVLRPHLVRLEHDLDADSTSASPLTRDAQNNPVRQKLVNAIRSLLAKLDDALPTPPGMKAIAKVYQRTADMLVALDADLQSVSAHSTGEESPLAVAHRARQAADDIVELLDVVAQNALGDTSRAGNALWRAAAIDPAQPGFEQINDLLNRFHADLEGLREFVPSVDGADIAEFLDHARATLAGYAADVTDDAYATTVQGIDLAIDHWGRAMDAISLGGRRPAEESCRAAAEAIRPLNRATALWFEDHAKRIADAPRVEQYSPNTVVGKALSEGWDAWDRGRGADAIFAAKRAADAAQTPAEALAARRLMSLSESLDKWLEREGPTSIAQTEAAERRVLGLLQPEEESLRVKFASQMPNMQIYLKAMAKGVVEPMREASAAAVRILFFSYVMRGVVAVQKENFDDSNIWKEAANKTLPNARLHPAFQLLENAIVRRQLVIEAVRVLNATLSVDGLPAAKQAVRAPLAAAVLDPADQAIRALEDALRRWSDGDFRAARQFLDNALERAGAAQAAIGKDLGAFKAWLQTLADTTDILAQARRVIDQAALVPADAPDDAVAQAHDTLVDLTRRDIGDPYTAQLRQWRDTYRAILASYTDLALPRDEQIRQIETHFASLFIDRQPAYPIYRHWRDVARLRPEPSPEDELPPAAPSSPVSTPVRSTLPARDSSTEEDVIDIESAVEAPRSRRGTPPPIVIREPETLPPPPEPVVAEAAPASRRRLPLPLVVALIAVVVIGGVLVAVLSSRNSTGAATTAANTNQTVEAANATLTRAASMQAAAFASISAGGTSAVTVANTVLVPTQTMTPNIVASPTITFTPSVTWTPSITPTPLPPTATDTPEKPVPTPTRGIPTSVPITPDLMSPSPTIGTPATLSAGPLPGSTLATASVALPTIPPAAEAGTYDVLAALNAPDKLPVKARTWDTTWFDKRGDVWQIGSSAVRSGRAPYIRFGPDILTPLVGIDAAQNLSKMEVEFEIESAEPGLMASGLAYFGIGFEALQGQTRTAIETQILPQNLIRLRFNDNGSILKTVPIPAAGSKIKVKLSVERGADKRVTLKYNDQQLGQTGADYPPNVPLTLLLYTSTGGVVVNITSFTVALDVGK